MQRCMSFRFAEKSPSQPTHLSGYPESENARELYISQVANVATDPQKSECTSICSHERKTSSGRDRLTDQHELPHRSLD